MKEEPRIQLIKKNVDLDFIFKQWFLKKDCIYNSVFIGKEETSASGKK